MTTSSIKRCLGLELSFGVRLALAWIAAGLVSVAGLAGCGGAPSDSGSNSSSNVLGGTAANTLQKRFDYPNVIDATFGNNGTVSMSTGYSEKVTVNGFETHDFIVDRLGRIVVVGTRSSAAREAWIYRMLADGSPDYRWAGNSQKDCAAPRRSLRHGWRARPSRHRCDCRELLA
jgi:hypothetical protein